MSSMSDYLENKLTDQIWRGQAFAFPTTLFFGLLTAAPSDTGGGTEVTGGSYARVGVVASLANFSGTQSAGSVVASSGNTGTTSNNVVIAFPAPTANWGVTTHVAVYDAATAGNLLFWSPLTASKTINSGDAAPVYPVAAYSSQIDN